MKTITITDAEFREYQFLKQTFNSLRELVNQPKTEPAKVRRREPSPTVQEINKPKGKRGYTEYFRNKLK